MDLRQFITWASTEAGALTQVRTPVSPHLELGRLMAALEGQPTLFQALRDFPNWRALSGLCAQREHFAAALDCTVPELVHRVAAALAHPREPSLQGSGPCQAITQTPVDLTRLPIPRYHPADAGRYVTSGVVIVDDPTFGRNISIQRLMLLDARRLAIRVVEGRGTHTALHQTEGAIPVAIAIGCPIQVLLAAATSPPKGVDELGIAHALRPTTLAQCQSVPLQVPAQAELILEGTITHAETEEGPFPDLTGTLDRRRQQPVVEVQRVTHRRAPIFHALLPGGLEHRNLMGMPREPTIFAAVNEVCRCTGVYVTPGGASWLHAVVQIEKQGADDGRQAIEAAFRGHSSLKHVVIVDTDVDLYDCQDVEWAIATRFQADRDLVLMADQPSSSLDPSATQVPGQKARTTKAGVDATAPRGDARRAYERVRYPAVDLAQYDVTIAKKTP
jgi:UbiD family decarboxylase